jgi:putative restriction endonuclease
MPIDKTLGFHLHCFKNLHRASNFGGAPHKPILLLSVIDNIEQNLIVSERIYITPELVGAFKYNWGIFLNSPHTRKFALGTVIKN